MLPKIPKLFKSKQEAPKDPHFLVLDIDQEKVSLGLFNSEEKLNLVDSVSEARTADLFSVLEKAMERLGANNQNLTSRLIIGINDPKIVTLTTIARLSRDEAHKEMTPEDIQAVLSQVGEDAAGSNGELFFSSVTSAVLDGVRINNPIGARGNTLELGCFNAYLESKRLDFYEKLAQEANLEVEKIVPTSFCVIKTFLDSGTKDGILLKILKNSTQVSFVEDSNIVGINQFSLGHEDMDYLGDALVLALKEFHDHPRFPELLSLYDTKVDASLTKTLKEHIQDQLKIEKELRVEDLNERLDIKGGLTLSALGSEGELQ